MRLIDADVLATHEMYDGQGFTQVVYKDDIDNAPPVEYPFYAEAYQTGYEEAKKELESPIVQASMKDLTAEDKQKLLELLRKEKLQSVRLEPERPQKVVTIPRELIEKLVLCVVDTVENIDWNKAIEAYKERPQGERKMFLECRIALIAEQI